MALLAALFVLFIFVGHGLAVLVNRTIDDEFGDPIAGIMPVYSPADKWTQGARCSTACRAKPAQDETFMGTWHDSSYFANDGLERSITITFHGSAIYAFFVLVPDLTRTASEVHLNFALDGLSVGVFNYVPGPMDSFHYNHSVYSNSNVTGTGPHTLVISTGSAPSPVLQFDYAVYSIDDTPAPHKSHLGFIIGSVICGFATISILIALLIFYRRRGCCGIRAYQHDDKELILVEAKHHPQSATSAGHHKTLDSDSFVSQSPSFGVTDEIGNGKVHA